MKHSSRLKSQHKVFRLIVLGAIIALVVGCQNPLAFSSPPKKANTEPQTQKIAVSGSEFTLAWDDAPLDQSTFIVYVRPHGSSQWNSIAKGLASYSLVITNGMLSYGSYEFAVSRVSAGGAESDRTTSLDTSAIPNTGWYLDWTP
jgi:hypothetical protein